jgi:DNA-binding transcriptional LysR family regulator
MMFRPRQLDVLRAVLELGSVTEAAQRLRVSQPAVSRGLQQAEDQLGFRLFLREHGRLRPTSEARALLPEILKAYAAIAGLQRLAEDLREMRTGLLSVAATTALANGLLAEAVQQFRARRPRVRVAMHTVLNHEVVELVAEHRVDLGLVLIPAEDSDTLARDLCATDLVCVAPPGHPLTRHASVGPAELQHWPLISFSQHLPIGALIEAAYGRQNLRRTIAVTVTQSATACSLVRDGVGVAVVDAFSVANLATDGLAVVPFTPRTPVVARLLRARHRPLPRIAVAFIDVLQRVVATEIAGGRIQPVAANGQPEDWTEDA